MNDDWSELQDGLNTSRHVNASKRNGNYSEDEHLRSFRAQPTRIHSRGRGRGTGINSTPRADNLSPTLMIADSPGSDANAFTATIPRRPSGNKNEGVMAGSGPSKRPDSNNPQSAKRKRQSLEAALDSVVPPELLGQMAPLQSTSDDGLPRDEMGSRRTPRSTRESAVPSGQPGQTTLLSRPDDDALPVAVETPDFDIHVKLQHPDTHDLDSPLFCIIDQELDKPSKANLKAWFVFMQQKAVNNFKPWWNSGKQTHIKCLGCKTFGGRDSVWQGPDQLFACQTCVSGNRPCMRLVFVERNQSLHREVRVLPRDRDSPFSYWGGLPKPAVNRNA